MTEFIESQKSVYPVAVMCRALEVSQSGIYEARHRPPSPRRQQDEHLAKIIRVEFANHRQTYGRPRITEILRDRGERVSPKRVARLMRENGLNARPKRKFVCTTQSKHDRGYAPNLLARDFAPDTPNRAWAGDITYVPTDQGWLYLAILLDLYSRYIIGYALSERIDDALTLTALQRAISLRNPPEGLIHHTDRGSQYASHDYRELLNGHGLVQSMSRKADCFDNAVAESTFATIEKDVLLRHRFATRDEGRTVLIDYIENFYNPVRKHSFLGHISPAQAETQYQHTQLTRLAA